MRFADCCFVVKDVLVFVPFISLYVPFLFISFFRLEQKRIRDIAPKIVQLLAEWTETFPYDFRDERMMRSLKEMTHRLAFGDEVRAAAFFSDPER